MRERENATGMVIRSRARQNRIGNFARRATQHCTGLQVELEVLGLVLVIQGQCRSFQMGQ